MTARNENALTIGRPGIDLLRKLEKSGALDSTHLELPDDLSYEQYEALGALLGSIKRATSWAIGDWIIFGESNTSYGEKYTQAVTATGLSEGTLQNYVYVCSRVAPTRRLALVPFSVHYEVAHLPPRDQRKWLARAQREQLTQRQLRALIREVEEAAGVEADANGSMLAGSTDHGKGLPRSYIVDGALCRRLVREAASEKGGYVRVPRDLIARLASVIGIDD